MDEKLQNYEQRIKDWSASLEKSHEGGHFVPNDQLYWTPLEKPIEEDDRSDDARTQDADQPPDPSEKSGRAEADQ